MTPLAFVSPAARQELTAAQRRAAQQRHTAVHEIRAALATARRLPGWLLAHRHEDDAPTPREQQQRWRRRQEARECAKNLGGHLARYARLGEDLAALDAQHEDLAGRRQVRETLLETLEEARRHRLAGVWAGRPQWAPSRWEDPHRAARDIEEAVAALDDPAGARMLGLYGMVPNALTFLAKELGHEIKWNVLPPDVAALDRDRQRLEAEREAVLEEARGETRFLGELLAAVGLRVGQDGNLVPVK